MNVERGCHFRRCCLIDEEAMIDIGHLLSGLVSTAGGAEFPEITGLVSRLDLDASKARIGATKRVECINGVSLKNTGQMLNVVWGVAPRRSIWLLFDGPSVPYSSLTGEVFGKNQQIQPSKFGAGFAIVFEIDGWRCGYTVDSEASNISAVFCESPDSSF